MFLLRRFGVVLGMLAFVLALLVYAAVFAVIAVIYYLPEISTLALIFYALRR